MSVTLETVAEAINEFRKTSRLDARLWDTADVAEFLKLNPAYTRAHILTRDDFPVCLKIPGAGIEPIRRWHPREVRDWFQNFRPNGTAIRRMAPRIKRPAIELHMQTLVYNAQRRSKQTGQVCDISFDFILELYRSQGGKCAVSGKEFSMKHWGGRAPMPFAPSIDRIDNNVGYSRGNVRIVCQCVNLMMNQWGEGVHKELFDANKERP